MHRQQMVSWADYVSFEIRQLCVDQDNLVRASTSTPTPPHPHAHAHTRNTPTSIRTTDTGTIYCRRADANKCASGFCQDTPKSTNKSLLHMWLGSEVRKLSRDWPQTEAKTRRVLEQHTAC